MGISSYYNHGRQRDTQYTKVRSSQRHHDLPKFMYNEGCETYRVLVSRWVCFTLAQMGFTGCMSSNDVGKNAFLISVICSDLPNPHPSQWFCYRKKTLKLFSLTGYLVEN